MPRPAPFLFDWGGISIPKSSNMSDLQAMKPDEKGPTPGMGQSPQAGQGTPPQYTPQNPRFAPQGPNGRWQQPHGPSPYTPREGQMPQQPGPDYGFAQPPPTGPQAPGGAMGGGTAPNVDVLGAAKKQQLGGMPEGWLKLLARAFI